MYVYLQLNSKKIKLKFIRYILNSSTLKLRPSSSDTVRLNYLPQPRIYSHFGKKISLGFKFQQCVSPFN